MNAGVLVDLAGLQSSAKGARVHFSASTGKITVTDGPFAETKELVAGYWIINVKSKAEAIEWAKRIPAPHGATQDGVIEIRQFFELEDFAPCQAGSGCLTPFAARRDQPWVEAKPRRAPFECGHTLGARPALGAIERAPAARDRRTQCRCLAN
jgi:hypothetical protein